MLQKLNLFFARPNFGLLFLRLAVGGYLTYAGVIKFLAGTERLEGVGKAIGLVGISVEKGSIVPLLFGILAALTEALGGLLLLVGFFFRGAALALCVVMVFATLFMYQVSGGQAAQFSFPMMMALVLFGMFWAGPGQYAVSKD